MKPRQLKTDKFTIYITAKGKGGQLPDIKFLHNKTSVSGGGTANTTTFKEIIRYILANSTHYKNLTQEEKEQWKEDYLDVDL